MNVNQKLIVTESEERYPDHRQEDTDGTKRDLGRCDCRGRLRGIHGHGGFIQRGEDNILAFLLLVIYNHGATRSDVRHTGY